ncbi:MAG: hypothetical protein IT221_16295 [Fluviicola sp.]|nr:hypothetical protein [Fluviicola sp.]
MLLKSCLASKQVFNCLASAMTVLFLSNASYVSGHTLTPIRSTATSNTSIEVYTYSIGVESIYRTKEVLAAVTDQLQVTHRYITATGFQFQSEIDYTETTLTQLFIEQGVPAIHFSKTTIKVPVSSIEKVGGTNCEQAEILCSNSSLSGNSAGFGTQELNGTNQGCLIGNEHQSSWYYLNIQTGGSLTMMIDPVTNTDDYDFAIWGPFTAATAGANCPPVTSPVRCSFSALDDRTGLQSMNLGTPTGCGFLGLFACGPSAVGDVSEGSGGDSFVLPLNVLANQIYILLVDNFSTSSNPYGMSFGGTAVLGCTPVVLPVEISSFSGFASEIGNVLKWKTESEKDNDYFLVERLINGTLNEWEVVEKVYSKGDTWTEKNYAIIDNDPKRDGLNYYRISQVDQNGNVNQYKDLVSINNTDEQMIISKVVNLMGQEVDRSATGILLYLFEDGTSIKVFR